MRGINAIVDLVSEGSATSEVKLAIGGVTVEGGGAVKETGYTEASEFAIMIPGGFASATNTFLLRPIDGTTAIGRETMRVERLLSDTTVTPAATKDIEFTLTLNPSGANEDAGTFSLEATITSDVPVMELTELYLKTLPGGGLPGTAEFGDDYTYPPFFINKLLFSGESEAKYTINLTITNDNVAEDDETIEIGISVGDASADPILTEEFTIRDDDAPNFTLTLNPSSANEGDDPIGLEATITSDVPVMGRITLYLKTLPGGGLPGTAEFGADYTYPPFFINKLLFSGESEAKYTINLTITDDEEEEEDETFEIGISVGSASADPTLTEEFTIKDDDAPTPTPTPAPNFTLTFDPSSASEGDGDFTFTATVTSDVAVDCSTVTCNSNDKVRFLVTFNNGSATSGNDWTAYYASFGVFLDDGGTSNTRSTTLEIVDDNVPEDDETIVVKAVNTDLGITLTGEFTIKDDDATPTLPTSITLSVSPSSVAENAPRSVMVTATVDGNGRFPQEQTVTATVGKSGDSAVEGTDYMTVNTVTITIAADAASGTGTFTLSPINDTIPESNETISVEGSVAGSTVTVKPATITITDNDTPAPTLPTSITLSVSPSSVAENAARSVTVTATVDGNGRFPQEQTVTATVGKSGDSAVEGTDYMTVNTVTITIAADAASGTGTFTLSPINDTIPESNETISVEGSVAGSTVTVKPATITITDNDTPAPTLPTSITLSVSPSSVAENAARSVTVTARVDGNGRFPQAQMVTATVGKSGDSAVEGTDYTTVNNVTIRIDANAASGTGSFMLTPMNDSIYEGSETISVEGSVASSTVTVKPATITITDNDTQSTALVLTLGSNSAEEDVGTANVGVTVRLNNDARPIPTPVTIRITDGTASSSDYSVSSPVSLQIPMGMTEITGTVPISIANDDAEEGDETVTITASTTGLTSDSENFTIRDDDAAPTLPTSITLSVSPSSVAENAEESVTVTATLDGNGRFLQERTLTAMVGKSGDSAVEGTDYMAVDDVTITIAADAASGERSFTLTPINDNISEGSETISVEGNVTGSAVTVTPATITITDNDAQSTALVLTLNPARLHEDSGTSWVRFTAGLDGVTRTMDTPVELRVTAGTAIENADYRTPVVPTSLMISSGETSLSDSLQMVITDNDTMEGNKTVVIEVSATGLNAATQELVIVDNESAVRVDTLMAEVNATGGYTITTPVRQNMGAPVTSVVLHYGDGMTFEMAPMEMSSEGSYTAELMAPEEGDILYYYVLATNEDGLTTTYPPEGRYLDISDYTGSSRLVLLDFEDGDAGDKSTVGHAVVYRGGEPTFAEDALVLDGVDDHAEILGSSLGASEEFALEIMFNADDFDAAVLDAGGTYLVSKPVRCAACWEESTFSLLWERSAASGTLLAARFWNPEYGESGQVELEIPMPLASGQWYHAVLEVQRRDAGQRALLRLRDQSGMLHGEDVAVLPALPVISTYPIFVGHIGDRGFFDGRIDDVGFYNYAHFGLSLASSEDAWEVPEGYVLEQNYPNPFNPVTTIRYDLAKVGHVHLEVSDLLGRRVTVLVDAVQEAGAQEVRFDARDLPSGMYLYRLRVEDFVSVKKMVLLK